MRRRTAWPGPPKARVGTQAGLWAPPSPYPSAHLTPPLCTPYPAPLHALFAGVQIHLKILAAELVTRIKNHCGQHKMYPKAIGLTYRYARAGLCLHRTGVRVGRQGGGDGPTGDNRLHMCPHPRSVLGESSVDTHSWRTPTPPGTATPIPTAAAGPTTKPTCTGYMHPPVRAQACPLPAHAHTPWHAKVATRPDRTALRS